MKMWDVVIIGAGPAGSSTAIGLTRRGYSVAMIDKAEFPRDKICGDFLNFINWPLLSELGVTAEVCSRPYEIITTFRLTSFSGDEVEIPFRANSGQTIFGLGLRRFDLDDVLVSKARRDGAVLFQSSRIRELIREPRGWCVRVDRAGMSEELRAKVLVGADGRNSSVARRLGMCSANRVGGRSAGIQFGVKSSGVRNKLEIHLFPGGYAGIIGVGGSWANLCLAIEKGRLSGHRPAELLVRSSISQNPWLAEIARAGAQTEMRSAYPVYFAPRRAYSERVLLVGDAARVTEPVTGEGVYFAIKSGLLAAETIHQAFVNNDFSSSSLTLYARKCRADFRLRQGFNFLIRRLVYRPRFLSRIVRFFHKRPGVLRSIVQSVCVPGAVSTEAVDKYVDKYQVSPGSTAIEAHLAASPKKQPYKASIYQ